MAGPDSLYYTPEKFGLLPVYTQDEASALAIAIVGAVHDKGLKLAWRDAASDVGLRLQDIRNANEEGGT